MRTRTLCAGLAIATSLWMACRDSTGNSSQQGRGTLVVYLTDAPFPIDSLESVNVFVVRVDARLREASEEEVARDVGKADRPDRGKKDDDKDDKDDKDDDARPGRGDDDRDDEDDHKRRERWITIGEPHVLADLMSLRHGATLLLGGTDVPGGEYKALRLIIDETRSYIVLKNGITLRDEESPFRQSGGHSGIHIKLSRPIRVRAGRVTETLIDFDLEKSFAMRGHTMRDGLTFKPELRADVRD